METENIISAADRFFLDFIGLVLPGAALVLGLWVILGQPTFLSLSTVIPEDVNGWLIFVPVCYTVGHLVNSIAVTVVLPFFEFIISRIIYLYREVRADYNPYYLMPETMLMTLAMGEVSFVSAHERIYGRDLKDTEKAKGLFRDLRSSVMSRLSPSDRSTIIRFTFTAQFNIGIASALAVLAIVWLSTALFSTYYQSLGLTPLRFSYTGWLILLVIIFLFLERYFRFTARSLRTPFSMFASDYRASSKGAQQ
ncbi:hypothetical protein Mterra_00621 [Calidithermus terrae]|uniref:Uncharacterized protein n=1 Tax=Calidithermus terrae TaxID=1408545 RepID=A0A399F3K3_9DEIN|nr:hypothetical protein [Calidithermus terrae]RIH90246.1 hypothetical protein Mterra_00621 [Calidithermus terrae]